MDRDVRSQLRVGPRIGIWRRDASTPRRLGVTCKAPTQDSLSQASLFYSVQEGRPTRSARRESGWGSSQRTTRRVSMGTSGQLNIAATKTLKRNRPHNTRGEVGGAREKRRWRTDSSKQRSDRERRWRE